MSRDIDDLRHPERTGAPMPNPEAVDYRALHEAAEPSPGFPQEALMEWGAEAWRGYASGDLVEAAPLRAEVEALRAFVAEVRSLRVDSVPCERIRDGEPAESACECCEWKSICDEAERLSDPKEVPHE